MGKEDFYSEPDTTNRTEENNLVLRQDALQGTLNRVDRYLELLAECAIRGDTFGKFEIIKTLEREMDPLLIGTERTQFKRIREKIDEEIRVMGTVPDIGKRACQKRIEDEYLWLYETSLRQILQLHKIPFGNIELRNQEKSQ